MGNKLYVGNLPYSFRDEDLQQTFSQYGSVGSAKVMMERDTGRSKGFGFVEMGSDAEAQAAIQGVHGQNFGGRDLVVNEARPMEPRAPRSGGFGGGNGGGGYGGGRSGGGYGGGYGSKAAYAIGFQEPKCVDACPRRIARPGGLLPKDASILSQRTCRDFPANHTSARLWTRNPTNKTHTLHKSD